MTKLEELLKEIEDRAEKATPEPWEIVKDSDGDLSEIQSSLKTKGYVFETQTGCDEEDNCYWTICNMPVEKYGYGSAWATEDNSEFITHARTDVPRLVKALRFALEALDSEGPSWHIPHIENILEGK